MRLSFFVRIKIYVQHIHDHINKIVNVEPVSNTLLFANKSSCDIGPKYKNSLMEVIKNNGIIK